MTDLLDVDLGQLSDTLLIGNLNNRLFVLLGSFFNLCLLFYGFLGGGWSTVVELLCSGSNLLSSGFRLRIHERLVFDLEFGRLTNIAREIGFGGLCQRIDRKFDCVESTVRFKLLSTLQGDGLFQGWRFLVVGFLTRACE